MSVGRIISHEELKRATLADRAPHVADIMATIEHLYERIDALEANHAG